ncbi:MAG: hypothetical protein ACJAZ5_003199 [Alloalcanivorax venustensis]|jgi:hypothetical protein|nr:hypothetical protein ASALC70_03840 [Alcanivorax sp. ALC70]SMO95960.1 hypothetical protein SAMN06272769_1422 [Alcanivorax sp. DSM 26295]|tara:strand:- start:2 stop:187 length:186 start_codon:yes stop_codon:yes gene_type:complete
MICLTFFGLLVCVEARLKSIWQRLQNGYKVYAYFNELTYEDGTTGDEEEERTLGVGMEHKF